MIAANLGHCPFISIEVCHDVSGGIREPKIIEYCCISKENLINAKIKSVLLTFGYVKTGSTLKTVKEYFENIVNDLEISGGVSKVGGNLN